jgi:hypothetical protein
VHNAELTANAHRQLPQTQPSESMEGQLERQEHFAYKDLDGPQLVSEPRTTVMVDATNERPVATAS